MCLFNPMKINRSDDITVYKILGIKDGELHSPIYDYLWPVGETMSINDKPLFKEYHNINFTTTGIIGNAFHTYRNEEDAINASTKIGEIGDYDKYVIAECVIPSASKFVYLGTYNRSDDCYASEKLTVVSYREIV